MKIEHNPPLKNAEGFFCTQNAHKAHTKILATCYNLIMNYFSEERRLIAAGIPLDEAITLCQSMRREGGLAEFVAAMEERGDSR